MEFGSEVCLRLRQAGADGVQERLRRGGTQGKLLCRFGTPRGVDAAVELLGAAPGEIWSKLETKRFNFSVERRETASGGRAGGALRGYRLFE